MLLLATQTQELASSDRLQSLEQGRNERLEILKPIAACSENHDCWSGTETPLSGQVTINSDEDIEPVAGETQ